MIFYTTIVPRTEAEVILKFRDGKWDVGYQGKHFIFDPKLVNFHPDIANLYYGMDNAFHLQWGSETINDKTGFASSMWRNRMPITASPLASFFVESSTKVHVFTKRPVALNAAIFMPHKNVESNKRAEEVFATEIPLASEYMRRAVAKRKLLGRINTNDSMAMLEAQLDLLTHVVLNDSKAEDAKSVLSEALLGNTVDEIHNLAKLKQTIQRQKRHLRLVQMEYLRSKGGMLNADLSS